MQLLQLDTMLCTIRIKSHEKQNNPLIMHAVLVSLLYKCGSNRGISSTIRENMTNESRSEMAIPIRNGLTNEPECLFGQLDRAIPGGNRGLGQQFPKSALFGHEHGKGCGCGSARRGHILPQGGSR